MIPFTNANLDIPFTDINVRRLLDDGTAKNRARHRDHEASLRGLLRAGSCGVLEGDIVYGECHRIGHLRHVGIEKAIPVERQPMLDGGEANEDLWERVLIPSWDGEVVRHQEVKKQGSWGTVMGHPDIVLAKDGNPLLALELKLVSSTNSAIQRDVHGEPDSKHLIQSATYMWLTGLPVALCYTVRADFSIEFQRKKLGRAKVEPGYRIFYLTFKNDQLFYRDEYSSDVVPTIITGKGIKAYYQRVADMAHDFNLGGRPSNDHVNGASAAWNKCDRKYCSFADVCDLYEGQYQTWRDAAKRIAEESQ